MMSYELRRDLNTATVFYVQFTDLKFISEQVEFNVPLNTGSFGHESF